MDVPSDRHAVSSAPDAAPATRMPSFIIIGAVKGGTTSLYRYVGQHPDVFMSATKEPSFFAYEGHPLDFRGPRDQEVGAPSFAVTSLDRYQALFADGVGYRARGEASPVYLFHPDAPARMARHVPHARLIAILRDPAERAFSNYAMFLRDRRETLRFRAALEASAQRQRDHWTHGWQYLELGFYARQLARYHALFDPQQIKVLFYEDLKTRPLDVCREVFEFIGVDPGFLPDVGARHNVSFVKRRWLDRWLNRPSAVERGVRALVPGSLRRRVRATLEPHVTYRPQLSAVDRRMLIDIYRDDILALQRLTGRDLTAWLT